MRKSGRSSSTDLSALVLRMENNLARRWPELGVVFCDELAMFGFLFPDLAILKESKEFATVETKGEFTRGMLVVDRRHLLHRRPNCAIVQKVDVHRFWRMMIQALR